MYKYSGITINTLINGNSENIFQEVIVGAAMFYKATTSYLSDYLGTEAPSFLDSKIYANINLLKDYVLFGKCPESWSLDDLGSEEYDVINSLYMLFKVRLEFYNYNFIGITESERYFCCFVLSAFTRFRYDGRYWGEFLTNNIEPDDEDGDINFLFTQAELAALIGVSASYFARLIENIDSWISDPNVLLLLKDDKGKSYYDMLENIKERTKHFASSKERKEHEINVVAQWNEKFSKKTKTDSGNENDDETPRAFSILQLCDELSGYLKYRSYTKKIDFYYDHKQATCLLNLLAVKGYYSHSY
ncbi:hypothetical protein [Rheinheimera sp.]|uniref:hypothetical protein n=1 Tax=Rheinheimera sp. TaxID=1869214 RepID=UPI002736EE5E|nr:hypothetical protein [Rheinheimera sp.]MDP2716496.1 hypothetical protein [Rheinheimera sp.]